MAATFRFRQSSGVFDEDFHDEVTRRFSALFAGPHDTGGQFDGPFSVAELVGALSRCAESAVGGDGLPYSLFKFPLPWWRSAWLNLFNLCLHWNDVPTMWKHSVIVPVFKTGQFQAITDRSLWRHVASKCWSTWSIPELLLTSRRSCTAAKAVSAGVQT